MKELIVELSTPSGFFFSTTATSIDLHTEQGSIHITPDEGSFLNMSEVTEITLTTKDGPLIFELENAAAGLSEKSFTVLAEHIRRIEPEIVSN